MSRTPNPPIKGHELICEGFMCWAWGSGGRRHLSGGCRCGALPPNVDRDAEGCPLPSAGAVKRWHREHKAELRGAL